MLARNVRVINYWENSTLCVLLPGSFLGDDTVERFFSNSYISPHIYQVKEVVWADGGH